LVTTGVVHAATASANAAIPIAQRRFGPLHDRGVSFLVPEGIRSSCADRGRIRFQSAWPAHVLPAQLGFPLSRRILPRLKLIRSNQLRNTQSHFKIQLPKMPRLVGIGQMLAVPVLYPTIVGYVQYRPPTQAGRRSSRTVLRFQHRRSASWRNYTSVGWPPQHAIPSPQTS
jgi:hypothetical protein